MKNIFTIVIFSLFASTLIANNVQVTNLTKSGSTITFDISWENSWRQGTSYHDAVWVFVKQAPNGGPSWTHAKVTSATVGTGYTTEVPSDQVGFFVRRTFNAHGTASTSVSASMLGLTGVFQDIKVMAIEMVHIPEGSFYAGDGGSGVVIARGDDITESIHIVNDGALTCGTASDEIQYSIGPCGDIPATYPAGYDAFYCMKYVITQSQYVDFLNCLPRAQQEDRVQADVTGSTVTNYFVMADHILPLKGNVIRCDETIGTGNITFYCDRNNNGIPNQSDDGQSRACNYMSSIDWTAYLDWAGLRPFTFLEAEKAARGPIPSVPNEYSWGSTLYNSNGTIQNAGTATEKWSNSNIEGGISTYSDAVIRVGCNAPSSSATRELSNASFYGVIDLGNNPGDYYINPFQTTYEPIEGDGTLSTSGEANTETWPAFTLIGTTKIKLVNSSLSYSQLSISTISHSASGGGRGVRSNF